MDLHVQLAIIGRVALGAFLGYILGLDRALRGKDAGDRTFSLVALGSAAFVALGVELYPDSADRVIQGVTAGIGFLGAGIIFRASGGVKGLTTAAALWTAAAVGCLVGAGLYVAGAGSPASSWWCWSSMPSDSSGGSAPNGGATGTKSPRTSSRVRRRAA